MLVNIELGIVLETRGAADPWTRDWRKRGNSSTSGSEYLARARESIGSSNQITAFTTIGLAGLSMWSQAASALGSCCSSRDAPAIRPSGGRLEHYPLLSGGEQAPSAIDGVHVHGHRVDARPDEELRVLGVHGWRLAADRRLKAEGPCAGGSAPGGRHHRGIALVETSARISESRSAPRAEDCAEVVRSDRDPRHAEVGTGELAEAANRSAGASECLDGRHEKVSSSGVARTLRERVPLAIGDLHAARLRENRDQVLDATLDWYAHEELGVGRGEHPADQLEARLKRPQLANWSRDVKQVNRYAHIGAGGVNRTARPSQPVASARASSTERYASV